MTVRWPDLHSIDRWPGRPTEGSVLHNTRQTSEGWDSRIKSVQWEQIFVWRPVPAETQQKVSEIEMEPENWYINPWFGNKQWGIIVYIPWGTWPYTVGIYRGEQILYTVGNMSCCPKYIQCPPRYIVNPTRYKTWSPRYITHGISGIYRREHIYRGYCLYTVDTVYIPCVYSVGTMYIL